MHKHTKQTASLLANVFFQLTTDFPQLFDPTSPKPLSFSIKEQLEIYYKGELKLEHIHYFLREWTHRMRYYRAVLAQDYRFDLSECTCRIEDRHKVSALKSIQQLLAPPK